MLEIDRSEMAQVLPLRLIFDVLGERRERREREEIWRAYMANVVSMLGGKEAKTYTAIMEEYERAKHRSAQDDVQEAYSNAEAVFASLERARGGV